jgi:hypothetical protein
MKSAQAYQNKLDKGSTIKVLSGLAPAQPASQVSISSHAAFSLFLRLNFEPCAAHRVPVVALASYVRIKANA